MSWSKVGNIKGPPGPQGPPGTGGSNAFGTVSVPGQGAVVADAAPDTLTLVAGANVTLTTDPSTDAITIAAAGGTGGTGAAEVWEGPEAPVPQDDYLVWIDTDAVAPVAGGDLNFVYTQLSPASSWPVAHNLGKFPAVEVVDSGNSVILPDVVYIDTNHLTLLFGSLTSGKAYLN